MHFHIADAYEDTGSPLHRWDARVKVVLALLMILLVALTPMGAFGAYIGFFALMMGGALIARLDPLNVLRRSLVALPFAAAAAALIFTIPGPVLGHLPLIGWPISAGGLVRFVSIALKSTISVQAAVLLITTTPFTDILWALGALRLPKVLVAIVSFMYRYLFLMAEEAVRLSRARDARSAAISGHPAYGGSLIFRARTTGRLIGNLFARSFARSERIYQAMLARGYRGEIRLLNPPPLRARDVLMALIPLLLGVGLLIASLL